MATLIQEGDLAPHYGPMLVCSMINLLFAGGIMSQSGRYFSRYSKTDRKWRLAYVAFLTIGSLSFACVTMAATWAICVTQDYRQQILDISTLYATQIVLSKILIDSVRWFYLYRLYLLSGWRLLTLSLVTTLVANFGLSLASITGTRSNSSALPGVIGMNNATAYDRLRSYMAINVYVGFVVDVVTAFGISYFMLRQRRRQANSPDDQVVWRVSALTVIHLSLIAVCSVMQIIAMQLLASTSVSYLFNFIRIGILIAGVLHSFNIRAHIVSDWKTMHTTHLYAGSHSKPTAALSVDIQMTQVVTTDVVHDHDAISPPEKRHFAVGVSDNDTLKNF